MKRVHLLAILEATTVTGPAKNLLQFAKTVASQDDSMEVSIVTFHRAGDPDVFAEAAASSPVALHRIEEKGRFDRSVIKALADLVHRVKPDIVQSHAVKSHAITRAAGLHRVAPWVAFHHGYTWTDLRARAYNQLDRWSLRSAHQVVTVSEPFRTELQQIGVKQDRVMVLHNAIAPHWGISARASGDALRTALNIPAGKKVLLIVGRLSLEKDHLALLDALAQIHRGGRATPHLLIVGHGPERARIDARIQQLSLSSHVTFTGQVNSAEPYYGVADVAVLSSRTEGSPNALLEAMAARVPVVATTVGGIPEIVNDRVSALLVAPGDPPAMAAVLTEILTDSALAERLASASRILVETRFSPEARASRLKEMYRGLLTASSGRGS